MMENLMQQPLDVTLPNMGERRLAVLKEELEVDTYDDLLHCFPYKYVDRSRFYKIRDLHDGMPYIQLRGVFLFFDILGEGRRKRLVGKFSDGSGVIDIIWFKGLSYVTKSIKTSTEYVLFGKPTRFGNILNIAHPELELSAKALGKTYGLVPFYNTTERMKRSGLNSKFMQQIQYHLLKRILPYIQETLPEEIIKKYQLCSYSKAIRNIHFPTSSKDLRDAQIRLKFEELFYLQLRLVGALRKRQRLYRGVRFEKVGDYFNHFYHHYLPFELTGAQKRVLREIRYDTGRGIQMNRLLQGDVGSGKTLVGLLAMLLAIDNDTQACMMVPTEILAIQHYETIRQFLDAMPIRIGLLTGSTTRKERNELLPAIAEGEIDILIGTHALIEETVRFKQLGLAIIDEQHRFGVEQRSRLWRKNTQIPPHVLVMTATPIPRTLAMTLYGDLDISIIDELPPGRKPIVTRHYTEYSRPKINSFLWNELKKGRQVYVVYPLIEESEKMDILALEQGFNRIKTDFPGLSVGMVHGRMKPAEKDKIMKDFEHGKVRILLATTVIEVGVNIPNATVMVVENAERFGLAQLHQLRGRVGRGGEQSFCLLISGLKLSAATHKRLEIMVESTDGFRIAEEDMKLRGHGNIEGTQQSGMQLELKIANLATDGQLLQLARHAAEDLLEKDVHLSLPKHQLVRNRMRILYKDEQNWGRIG